MTWVRFLTEKAGKPISVQILADLLDIPDPRWINVIEGYLNRQKQYLLVEPAYYIEALVYYNQIRKEHHLYDVSLIDGEKVLAEAPKSLTGSLAEEIVTDHPQARAYVDYLLGRVIKCDRIEDLRCYERARDRSGYTLSGVCRQFYTPPTLGIPSDR